MAPKHPISQSKSCSIFISLVISVLLLTSCGLPVSIPSTPLPPSPTPTAPLVGLPSPTSVPPSPTPQPVLDTPTSIPPSPTPQPPLATPVLPGPTSAPIAITAAGMGSIAFTTGTTAGVVQGTVQPGQVLAYTLGAEQAQPLTLIMDSPNNDVTLGVFEPNGNTLLDPTSKLRAWQMVLPATELYTIQVIGGATTESFTLTVKLPVLVYFASGATSATLNGTTVNGYLFSYALNCAAGQTMTANLNVPSSTATIDIYGLSSGTLLDVSAGYNAWTGVLPQTQDYVIEVVPANNLVVNYSLTVSCTNTPGATYNPPVNPPYSGGNIVFEPGTTAAVMHGMIQPGQVETYTLEAGQFQPMILILESPNNDLSLGVYDPNGNLAFDPAKMYRYWQWQLPETGLYTIHVIGGTTTENFTLTTKVAKLVTFPADGTSITLYGTTHEGFIISYAFRLSAGDVMTATLNVPASKAYLDVFGVQTGSLLNASVKATTWTGTLATTQEYVVEVIPTGGYLMSFALTISNP